MVKPGGTGRPRLAISARLAPLPPSKSRRPAFPSALPSPKVNTHLPDFAAATAAGLRAATLRMGFDDGLAGLFFAGLFFNVFRFNVFRAPAGGVALTRIGMDDFDFAAIFLGFATALAMTENNPREGKKLRALHHFGRPRASRY